MKITQKLWMIAISVSVSLTVLAMAAHTRAKMAHEEALDLASRAHEGMLLSDISYNVQRVLMTAMDIIVDREEGIVSKARRSSVDESYANIQKDIEALKEVDRSRTDYYQQIADQSAKVYALVTKDLYSAVEEHHRAEQFSELDDKIDDAGSELIAPLQTDAKKQLSEFDATVGRADESMLQGQVEVWGVYGGSILFMLICMALTQRSITRPLKLLTQDINEIAGGNADITIQTLTRTDELGVIAKALEKLRLKAEESFQMKRMIDDMPINVVISDIHNDFKISYANNTTKKTLRAVQNLLPIAIDDLEGHSIDIFHKNPERIRTLLSNKANLPHHAKIKVGPETLDLRVSAMTNQKGDYVAAVLTWSIVTQSVKLADDFEGSIGAMSQQIGSSATALQERATSLHSAIEELSVAALEISKRVHDSLDIVRQAVETGDNANSMTNQLSSSAERISDVVTLIRSIAEKTNLLALNATIESARAGEAGKGFAVVANEVKSLASQTAHAISEISKQILDMQTAARSTADAIIQMSEIVKNVNTISTTIAATVEEQQAATTEIARNISGTQGMLHGTETLTIMGMATQMTDVSSHLQQQCDTFLQKVRAM